MSTSKIDYIDIESLLDLRLGAIGLIDEKFAADLIATPEYYERCFDSFSFGNDQLNSDVLKRIMDEMRPEIVRNAFPTAIIHHLCSIVNQREFTANTQPNVEFADIHVSVKGCNFSPEEKAAFAESIKAFVPSVNVKCVEYSIGEIDFDVVKSNYFSITVYNLSKAMLPFEKAFTDSKRFSETVVYAPRLFNTRLDDESIALLNEYKEDPFYLGQGVFSEFYFRSSFLPVNLYCAMTPYNPCMHEKKGDAEKL